MLGGLFGGGDSELKFWNWFAENNNNIAAINDGNLLIQPKLDKQLKKYDKSLGYELVRNSAGENLFYISTKFVRDVIPTVMNLVNAAPELSNWKIHQFIPKKNIHLPITWNALELRQEDIGFEYTLYKSQAHLRIYIKGYDMKDERHRVLSVSFLKAAFGEFDFMTKIGALEYVSYTTVSREKNIVTLSQLIEIVDNEVR
jgi:hypothetical protein